jgi:LytS/YehU family sensor histidine kinase
VFWVVVCGAHALLFYQRSQERERRSLELAASLARAKLQALRMQLQPHFLFNTLNAISTLVHRDPRAADEMIGNLSDFLRLTLEPAEQQEIPLGEELKFVERYLAIERVRFGDRLRVEVDVPADLLATPVPSLLLQPLVENAVRHGLEPLGAAGLLRIVAKREGDRLWIAVIDNGRGLPGTPTERVGIGMANTRERLAARYGAAAGIMLRPAEGGGTSAEITLPLKSSGPGPEPESE